MVRKSKKIKITVIEPKDNLNLRLPAIPFWLIHFLSSIVMLFKPIILNKSNLDEDIMYFLNNLDSRTIKIFINEFRMAGPFDMVNISTGEGTVVKVSIL